MAKVCWINVNLYKTNVKTANSNHCKDLQKQVLIFFLPDGYNQKLIVFIYY